MNPPQTPHEWLLFALSDFGIATVSDNGRFVEVEKDYTIEI